MKYRNVYRAIYDFHARYAPYPRTLTDWEQAIDDMIAVSKQLESTPFVCDMLCAIMNEMERESKAEGTEQHAELHLPQMRNCANA